MNLFTLNIKFHIYIIVKSFLVVFFLLFGTTYIKADFRVCNATQGLVGVSIGYRGAEGWITEGWWQIKSATCATLIEGQLSSRYYYLYAEDAERGDRWDGPIKMCIAEKEFKITGVNDCYTRGYQRMGFNEYDTGKQGSWMVQLTDKNDKPQAEETTIKQQEN